MNLLKRIWNIFHSMKCAILLLVILAAACVAGSLIPQGEVAAYYTTVYPQWAGEAILTLGLDHMFTVWWFILLAALLCINLILCSILRFPQLLRNYQNAYTLEARKRRGNAAGKWDWIPNAETTAEQVFSALHFRCRKQEEDGEIWYYAVRNRFGIWGSWICHLGMIAVIIGFGIGQRYMLDTYIYGVPGQEKQVEGTDIRVAVDDFEVILRDDYTVEQYQAQLTVTDGSASNKSGITKVNAPFHAFGMDFFQNSTGWAATAKAYKGDKLLKEEILCQGEFIELDELPLVVQMTAFYPDYYNDGSGPQTLTPILKNPVVIYTIYYDGNFFSMDAIGTGLPIQIDEYRFIFENPQQYTLIQIVKDPTLAYVALGSLLMIIGIVLAFFCRTEELWMCEDRDGTLHVFCRSVKGAELFADVVESALSECGQPQRIKEKTEVEGYVTDIG